ncbi:nucleotidyltransferase domain-containing protein [bacterium]|nr:nucleotidyltransferase domain-containing protein [bacterium]
MYSADILKNESRAICEKLKPIFEENGVRSAVLFGSHASGRQTENSDIDILADSGLRGLRFYGLLEDICSAVGSPVDLIDVCQLEADSKMAQNIDKTGVLIYERARSEGHQNDDQTHSEGH